MASKVDISKTNDFLRRRKLRLQQVREQSKDIARKIRQRAKVENLRHLDSIEAKKEKEYFDCQEKLVKHLELLYSKGLQNVGAGHKDALEVPDQDCVKKTDISKLRGKEAAEALRKKKQEKLDEQKKILDRKLQAREAANELSREKSATVSKNLSKQTSKKCEDLSNKHLPSNVPDNQKQDKKTDNLDITKNDMGTQWESDELPNEWVPNVPVLSLPKDDSVKESLAPNTEKTDKSKRLNLFALSDEMPSSLRGGLTGATEEEPVHIKPSLTLVSEYLQNRNLRLREPQPSSSKKTDDLQTIKQTILHTRAARTDGYQEKSSLSSEPNTGLSRKKSIPVYNHNTRNIQNKQFDDERLVSRDSRTEEDAYAQALKETTLANPIEHEQLNKHQKDTRTKVAVIKNNVDKEYKDTLAFLNSLARDNRSESEKPIKTAYMDEYHQHLRNERYQRKLQDEFKKIEKECQKQNCKHSKRKVTISDKSRSPVQREMRKDFEYSWMPVPESDRSFAVHTIPNINTRNKSGNTVKFSQADSYHEYRSRHKHTPPTKDIINDRQHKTVVEKVILQETYDSDANESSVTSEMSSVENLNLEKDKTDDDSRLKDAERIIIYKILESKKDRNRKEHKTSKTARFTNTADVTNKIKQKVKVVEEDKKQTPRSNEKSTGNIQREVSFEQLQEGVYEAVNNNGNYFNIRSCYTANVEMWQSTTKRKPWWDNMASMYFTEGSHDNDSVDQRRKCNESGLSCCCNKNKDSRDGGDTAKRLLQGTAICSCSSKKENSKVAHPSAATSATSFTTAVNDKTNNCPPDGGFIKLVEDGGCDSNKFYVGASGFLKDDNYEVIIQLRKKDTEKSIKNDKYQPPPSTKPVNSLDIIQEKEQNIKDSTPNIKRNEENNVIDNTQQDIEESLERKQEQAVVEVEPEQQNLGSQLKKLCEKAVHTSFQDEFAIPANVSKTDPVSRPATSTYTQTSFNSSMPRPAFIHMSSSTSTAYMSPPEHILPKLLKNNYVLTKEELFESENTMNQLDSNFDVIDSEHCNGCRCSVCERYQLKTPPNTARTCSKESSVTDCARAKKRKCKCHKCRSRSDTNICHKNHRKKCITSKTKSMRDLPTEKFNVILKQSAKNKVLDTHTNSKSNKKMNPMVKEYVNKLLALNSEGLKAIEIINQDCSAVTTPGSSIINLPCNKNKDKPTLENKISLEQIKDILKQHILKDTFVENVANNSKRSNKSDKAEKTGKKSVPEMTQNSFKLPKKKSLHKVKSLNISKHILKKKKPSDSYISTQRSRIPSTSVSSSAREEKQLDHTDKQTPRSRNKSSATPRKYAYSEFKNSTSSDIVETSNSKPCSSKNTKTLVSNDKKPVKRTTYGKSPQKKHFNLTSQKPNRTSFSSDSDAMGAVFRYLHPPQPPIHTSTQTNGIIDNEMHFMKIAEDKLQNMEKIADLTEKCTKRLSNLAKVLEEVRRNKSLVYSHISTSDSTPDSDPKPGRNELSTEISGHISDSNILPRSTENFQYLTSVYLKPEQDDKHDYTDDTSDFTPFLKDIPKPDVFKTPSNYEIIDTAEKSTKTQIESENIKSRAKPPPALSRMHLKFGEDVNIIPHELSTVIEVDSPMSMKIKSQTSRQDTKLEEVEKSECLSDKKDGSMNAQNVAKEQVDPDLLKSNINLRRRLSKLSLTDSSDDSKMHMMDMNKFNDIMLKPFISLKEYAKQHNVGLGEGSNLEDVLKNDPVNDELSSLHSDGSLPDVIAELLKRNVISEPFKFDTASNVNSTTVSSESTLSVLALSKVRKEKKKSAIFLRNKENLAETSETLSLSSNPDLENAFQKLGMGWASSTLKKTKERLALSSSSNTSSSSMTQFKIKSFSQDVPNLGTDSTSSLPEYSNKRDRKVSSPGRYNTEENSKNAVQQTSLTNSMTVKEFLTNELAKKITFNNKSTRNEEEEFVSLYETKIPEEMKHTNVATEEEQSSAVSLTHNRARTSTPVQIFKSQTYHSTSTSNTSNGFFSNADDLSSVKVTSASIRNHSTSDKDDLTVPNYSLKTKNMSDRSKSD